MEVKVKKEFELHTNHKAREDDIFNLITILNDIDDYIFVLEKWGHIFMVHFGNEFVANEHLEFNYRQEEVVSAEVWITENEANCRIAEKCKEKEKEKEIEYWKSKCMKLLDKI